MWFEKGLDSPQSDYADLQRFAAQVAEDGDVLVEVGCFVGESIAHFIDLITATGKRPHLYAVDLFDVEEMCRDGHHAANQRMNNDGLTPEQWIARGGPRCMLADFYRNLRHRQRDLYLTGALVGRSTDMATLFADQSVRYCFLDAGHSYENVRADLYAWHRKVRHDGIFAGHDWFSSEEIRRAVSEFAVEHGLTLFLTNSSWVLIPPNWPLADRVTTIAPAAAA